jgi:hypothetical protein
VKEHPDLAQQVIDRTISLTAALVQAKAREKSGD